MQKTAVVTGASYGLGAAISNKLIDLGYKVYGISRTKPKIDNPNYIWIKVDLLQNADFPSILEQVSDKHLDLLINNAGACFLKKTLDYTDSDFEEMFAMNFKVHAKLTKLFFEKLTDGLVINISSLADRYPDPTWGLYGSSKAALNLFFETMANENRQVKIINILPSYVDTPMQHRIRNGTDFDWSQCMKPEDIADAIGNILADINKIVTGSRIIIEKNVDQDEKYIPEKLWVYSVDANRLKQLR